MLQPSFGFIVGISAVDDLMKYNAIRIPTFILSSSIAALRSSTVSYFVSVTRVYGVVYVV